MYWLEVSVTTDGEGAEAVSEVLRPFAHNDGIVLEQLGDMNDLDPTALEPEVTVKIYISGDKDTPRLRHRIEEAIYHLGRMYSIPAPQFHELADEDWATAWKAHYRPFRIGQHVWIQPSWLEIEADAIQPHDTVLTLDPGMAFGTGLHPTTQMCLQALEQIVQPGMSLLDVGCGSGILSILAAKLGADLIVAVDTDELAVKTTIANAEQNGVGDKIHVQQGTLTDVPTKQWDVVVVNILAPVIMGMLAGDDLLGYGGVNGRFIFSGIIDEQQLAVEAAIREGGGVLCEQLGIRDWRALIVKKKKP